MNILITGAAGFLARSVAPELLRRGHHVIGVDRNTSTALDMRYVGDICQSNVLDEISDDVHIMLHFAADVDRCNTPSCFIDNVFGVYKVADWASKKGVKRIVYPSTIGIFEAEGNRMVAESSIVAPQTIYTMSKYLGESCLAVSHVHAWVPRFPYIFGPGDLESSVAEIIRSVLNGQPVRVRDEARDLLFVEDVVDALIRVVEADRPEEAIMNFGTGALVPMRDVVEMVQDICGTKVGVTVAGTRRNVAVEYTFAKNTLGWEPAWSLQAGLEKHVAFIREFG